MRNHRHSGQLLRRHWNNSLCHGLSAAKDICRHRGYSDVLVCILNVADIGDVEDVRNTGNVSNVRDVYLEQIGSGVVIPRKEGLSEAKREPRLHADANIDGERGSVQKCDEGWSIDGQYGNGSGHPPPDGSD